MAPLKDVELPLAALEVRQMKIIHIHHVNGTMKREI
jgi:hypothetical protein